MKTATRLRRLQIGDWALLAASAVMVIVTWFLTKTGHI